MQATVLLFPTSVFGLGMLGTDKNLTAEFVREQFPKCVEFADVARDVFGDGVKVTFMQEGGRSVGTSREGVGNAVLLNEIVIESAPLRGLRRSSSGGWVAARDG